MTLPDVKLTHFRLKDLSIKENTIVMSKKFKPMVTMSKAEPVICRPGYTKASLVSMGSACGIGIEMGVFLGKLLRGPMIKPVGEPLTAMAMVVSTAWNPII
jgi:hypothetical protein